MNAFPPKREQSCENCRFACDYDVPDFSHADFTCHRHAQRPDGTDTMAVWPGVNAHDWCGDWTPDEPSDD